MIVCQNATNLSSVRAILEKFVVGSLVFNLCVCSFLYNHTPWWLMQIDNDLDASIARFEKLINVIEFCV